MPKQGSHSSKKNLVQLITRHDLNTAYKLASSVVLDKPKSRLSAFTNSSIMDGWLKDKSEELARLTLIAGSDSGNAEAVLKEVISVTLLEAFFVAYTFVSKIGLANSIEDPGAVQPDDLLKLELWERGLLSSKFYKFPVKNDPYLSRIKKTHRDVTMLIEKVKKMKSVTKRAHE